MGISMATGSMSCVTTSLVRTSIIIGMPLRDVRSIDFFWPSFLGGGNLESLLPSTNKFHRKELPKCKELRFLFDDPPWGVMKDLAAAPWKHSLACFFVRIIGGSGCSHCQEIKNRSGKRMGAGFMIPAGRFFGGSRSSLLVEKRFKIVETCIVCKYICKWPDLRWQTLIIIVRLDYVSRFSLHNHLKCEMTPSTTNETKRTTRSGLLIDLLCAFFVPQGRLGFAQFHLTCLGWNWGIDGLPLCGWHSGRLLGKIVKFFTTKTCCFVIWKILADSCSIK